MKNTDGKLHEKSRLVAQNYFDKAATVIPDKSLTISRMGQRIALSLAPMMPDHTFYTRDISQAYLQSKYHLGQERFFEATK